MSQQQLAKPIVLIGQTPGSATIATRQPPRAALPRVYLLSPAHSGGKRAKMLFGQNAKFEVSRRLRTAGIPLGEAFGFMSPLYFRGKLTYAKSFACAPEGVPGTLIITPSRGLVTPETIVGIEELREISEERVAFDNPKYRDPLQRDLALLLQAIGTNAQVVLLGSIATRKYIPLLKETLGSRIAVPRKFVGLGNMQRGGLLLQCSREGCELEYVSAVELQINSL